MFASTKRAHTTTADPSALDALLDAEGAVAVRTREAERQAEALVQRARAEAALADEAAARELEAELAQLRERGEQERSEDTRTIRDEAERRRRRFANAADADTLAIARRLAAIVAPAPTAAT